MTVVLYRNILAKCRPTVGSVPSAYQAILCSENNSNNSRGLWKMKFDLLKIFLAFHELIFRRVLPICGVITRLSALFTGATISSNGGKISFVCQTHSDRSRIWGNTKSFSGNFWLFEFSVHFKLARNFLESNETKELQRLLEERATKMVNWVRGEFVYPNFFKNQKF